MFVSATYCGRARLTGVGMADRALSSSLGLAAVEMEVSRVLFVESLSVFWISVETPPFGKFGPRAFCRAPVACGSEWSVWRSPLPECVTETSGAMGL